VDEFDPVLKVLPKAQQKIWNELMGKDIKIKVASTLDLFAHKLKVIL
jgi:hypothetical protein